MNIVLNGKIAIITGAASGIGSACALKFAKEGATVVVADINDEGGRKLVEGSQAVVHRQTMSMSM